MTRPAPMPALVFVWENFGPYHMDRCEAVAVRLGDRFDVVGLEIGGRSETYAWEDSGGGRHFRKVTLLPGQAKEEVGWFSRYRKLLSVCRSLRSRYVFLCNYEHPDIFALAVTLRLLGRTPIVMQASKFDDKPRELTRELVKMLFYAPYAAALAGSERCRDYLRFLGLPRGRIFLGYDTVSLDRVRRLAGRPPAPEGTPFAERHFTIVARFVPKKNLHRALEAYGRYRELAGAAARPLHLCGSGELEESLRRLVAERGIAGVEFRGFLQAPEIARTLADTLTLLLPSIEEQFGLVVNEALALGVPVILSDNCGARDLLVRTAVNGYVIEPDNIEGLARLMHRIAADETEWRRMAEATAPFAPVADVEYFAEAVDKVLTSLGVQGSPTPAGGLEGGSAPFPPRA